MALNANYNGSGIEDDQYHTESGFTALLLVIYKRNGERMISSVPTSGSAEL